MLPIRKHGPNMWYTGKISMWSFYRIVFTCSRLNVKIAYWSATGLTVNDRLFMLWNLLCTLMQSTLRRQAQQSWTTQMESSFCTPFVSAPRIIMRSDNLVTQRRCRCVMFDECSFTTFHQRVAAEFVPWYKILYPVTHTVCASVGVGSWGLVWHLKSGECFHECKRSVDSNQRRATSLTAVERRLCPASGMTMHGAKCEW